MSVKFNNKDVIRIIKPERYQVVQYLTSTGSQYIDTEYTPSLSSKIRVKFIPRAQNVTGYFGSRKDPYRFCCTTFSSGAEMAFAVTNNSWPSSRIVITYNQEHDFIAENGLYILDGTEYTSDVLSDIGEIPTFKLTAVNNMGEVVSTSASYCLFQVWENNALVRDMIPCRRVSDQTLGMYDNVVGRFYQNAGTGIFEAGPDIAGETFVGNREVIKQYVGSDVVYEAD